MENELGATHRLVGIASGRDEMRHHSGILPGGRADREDRPFQTIEPVVTRSLLESGLQDLCHYGLHHEVGQAALASWNMMVDSGTRYIQLGRHGGDRQLIEADVRAVTSKAALTTSS